VHIGQYFSYPGRKFHYIAPEYLTVVDGRTVVPDCLAWVHARTFQTMPMRDHELMFADIVEYGYGRLREAPLVYSSRHGWRIANDKARAPGESPRDALLARLAAAGFDAVADESTDDE